MPRKVSVAAWGAALFISWNAILLLYLMSRPKGPDATDLTAHVIRLAEEAEAELEKQKGLLQQIHHYSGLLKHQPAAPNVARGPEILQRLSNGSVPSPTPFASDPQSVVIPILVVACDRPSVRKCLDSLLKYRPSVEQFPIIVSQDCGHAETSRVIKSYGDAITHINQPDLSEVPAPPEHRKFQGYYKISRHYRWALNQVLKVLGYKSAIVVEDDLEVAPDFYEYFLATHSLLRKDPSLWCVSAWNDNGKENLVEPKGSAILHRSDFFPGLGWLLLRELWEELEPKWPAAFWDDWVRRPEQRLGRACIRPELPRTRTFGRKGVSQGQFFDQHLRFIKLNQDPVSFTKIDLSYLLKENYDPWFVGQVYEAPKARAEEVLQGQVPGGRTVRVEYSTRDTFKAMARSFGVMDDLKSGVARVAYKGVVTFTHRGRRVFLAPPKDWAGYDPSWS
ncbi:alpha-1,3-mannosyl-glycoprotein 2-beta-N-acetylglucosaminyltransferase [Pyxicephalus adspersus]|uniref:Alpha-1,3-mannosyl-glycoprotein 2-beta-N-acetylglucosaminyltransferase n=1 Tax=Pyxicephalus adspersus TaxID=30357 RepID=A0AAV3A1H5_PYXAD|nr:TPA: hypothetical protein GDO54_017185 [Pyxicephalus adspersus]